MLDLLAFEPVRRMGYQWYGNHQRQIHGTSRPRPRRNPRDSIGHSSAALVATLTNSGFAVGGLFVVRMLAPFLTSPIAGIVADGLRTGDGIEHHVDVIVVA